jgi:hypothetical protein
MSTTDTTQTGTLVDERCRTTIAKCLDRISDVRVHYGREPADMMATSFAYALGRFLSFGGTIYPDGELGLVCSSWITVGMVFHQDSPETTLRMIQRQYPEFDRIDPSWPLTGTWSLHS